MAAVEEEVLAGGLDALPVPADRTEDTASQEARLALVLQAGAAIHAMRVEDLHRVLAWSATRPTTRGQGRPALPALVHDRGPGRGDR